MAAQPSDTFGHRVRRIAYCLLPVLVGGGAALVLLLAAGGPARSAYAGNLTFPGVCGASIQQCINGASAGDTILISAGDYTESLTLSKAVSLTGALSSTTILHALPNTRVLTVTGAVVDSRVVISGLTFTGGKVGSSPFCSGECNGGGVLITGTAQPWLSNLRLMSNTATYGAGLYANGDLTVSDSSFVGNVMGGMVAGGGLYVQGSARVDNSSFVNNYASQGGGLYAYAATVTGSRFVGNQNNGIYAGGPNVTVTGSSFTNNYADNGGGGLFTNYTATVNSTTFMHNNANLGGGLTAGHAVVNNSRFINNYAWASGGGGLYAYVNAAVSGSSFISNSTAGQGGGLNAQTSATLAGSSFVSNTAGEGGGLSARFVTLADSSLISNAASEGGGLATVAGAVTATASDFIGNIASGLSFGGAGIWSDGSPVTLTATRFISNDAQASGGAVDLFGGSQSSRVVNSLFSRNRSNSVGADVAFGANNLLLLDDTFAGPDLAPGAAVVVYAGSVGITDTIFASQTVAVDVAGGSVFQDYNVLFHNSADVSGTFSGGTHNVPGDPRFRDAAHDDDHLTAGSAAINTGTNVGVTTDFEGDPRPSNGGFDIGYDEYWLRAFLPLVARP